MIWNTDRMEFFAADSFEGMSTALPDRYRLLAGERNAGAVVRRNFDPSKVAVVVSGGGGNGPLFPGYVCDGLADAAVIGAPFGAPNAYTIYDTAKQLGSQNGALLIYNNFAGDYLNNDMALELLRMDGVEAESVASTDDIASAVGGERSERSGRCGIAFLIKLASSCAEQAMPLANIAALLNEAGQRNGTLSVYVDFNVGRLDYGAGFSGEGAVRSETHMSMERCASEMCQMLLDDLGPRQDERLFVIVNRLRNTSYADGYIFANLVRKALSKEHCVEQIRVGAFSNIADVYGFSISVLCAGRTLWPHLEKTCYADSFIF